MNSWFEVGEEVTLNSACFPEYSGDYIIQEIRYHEFNDSITGDDVFCHCADLGFVTKAGVEWWDFSALRKKHKPSDESFKDMMQNIKSDVRVVEGVV